MSRTVIAKHGHIDHPPGIPVLQCKGRDYPCSGERLCLIDQRRHPLHEIVVFGADGFRDGTEQKSPLPD